MRITSMMIGGLLLAGVGGASLAAPLAGDAVYYDTGGMAVVGPIPITGDLDVPGGTLTVDPFLFFGFEWTAESVELLAEGTYMRPDGAGGTITATVGAGQLGAYIVHGWNVNQMPGFMVWEVNSHATGSSYTTVDSDGDGVPGHAFTVGPFPGLSLTYDYVVGNPPPAIDVSIIAIGGNVQECSETGGSIVSLTADIELIGGAEPGLVEWYVGDESVGSGEAIDVFLPLGINEVVVMASTATGESDTAYATIEIRDTTAPALELAFVDHQGNVLTETNAGVRVFTRIDAVDACDPAPVSEGAAVPVFAVDNGDMIKIQKNRFNSVKLPTSAIDLTATATDASGNKATEMTVLTISD